MIFFALKYFMKYFWNISKISRCCWTTDNMTKIHPIQTNKSADIGAYRSCSFQQILLQCTSKESINGIFQYIISTNVHRQQTLAWRTDVISHNIYWNILPDEGLCRLYGRYLPGGRGICPGHWMSRYGTKLPILCWCNTATRSRPPHWLYLQIQPCV